MHTLDKAKLFLCPLRNHRKKFRNWGIKQPVMETLLGRERSKGALYFREDQRDLIFNSACRRNRLFFFKRWQKTKHVDDSVRQCSRGDDHLLCKWKVRAASSSACGRQRHHTRLRPPGQSLLVPSTTYCILHTVRSPGTSPKFWPSSLS